MSEHDASRNPYQPSGVEAPALVEQTAAPTRPPRSVLRIILLALLPAGLVYAAFVDGYRQSILDVVSMLLLSTLALWWQWVDSDRRGIRLGSFLPVLVILLQPLGMLLYAIKAGRWGWWRIFGGYVLVYVGYSAWVIGLMMFFHGRS
jgi:hypothetical protein